MTGFRALLPDVIEVAYSTVDMPTDVLFPEEELAVAAAVPKRRAEFASARKCARVALLRLGYPESPILTGSSREPLWPEGVVGSLTHCDGYRAAAIAKSQDVLTVGIDAEVHLPLPDGVVQLITVGEEARYLARLTACKPNVAWDRVLFSAKEAIYKAWFPLTHAWLNFTDCELMIDSSTGTFTGRFLVPSLATSARLPDQLVGRWVVNAGHVFTAVWEPAVEAS